MSRYVQTFSHICAAYPPNKFQPPLTDSSHDLVRLRPQQLFEKRGWAAKKIIIFSCQAGQGKTTQAYRFLRHHQLPFLWHQVDVNDSDPVSFFTALLLNCRINLPGFNGEAYLELLDEGEVSQNDLTQWVNLLLHDLDRLLKEDLYLVFDDLHLIGPEDATCELLGHLIDSAPARVNFILTSRRSVRIPGRLIQHNGYSQVFTNMDLAFTGSEVAGLVSTLGWDEIPLQQADEICQKTEGWVMGIIIATSGGPDVNQIQLPDNTIEDNRLDYFQNEILAQIPETLYRPLLQCSLLDEIHLPLAITITGLEDLGTQLDLLCRDNHFLRRLNQKNNLFGFHHLFRDFLRSRAEQLFSPKELQQIRTTACDYYLAKGQIMRGLTIALHSEAYSKMESIVKHHGMPLLAANRNISLLRLLEGVPEERLLKHGWLCLFAGLVYGDVAPQKTLSFLESSRQQLAGDGDEHGELLACSQLIYYHFVVSGRYHTGTTLLARTEELLENHKVHLAPLQVIQAARNLAAGFCFFTGDMKKASAYGDFAINMAVKLGAKNFIASCYFILGYIHLHRGETSRFLGINEQAQSFLNDPLVSVSNRLTLRIMELCHLCMHGRFEHFQYINKSILDQIDERVIKQTIAAPYLYLWNGCNQVGKGNLDKAIEFFESGLSISASAATEHMRSQLLQWKSYTLVLSGKKQEARTLIKEAARLRQTAGGKFAAILHLILRAAVLIRTDQETEGLEQLEDAIEQAGNLQSPYLQVCGLAQKCFCLFQLNRTDQGQKALNRLLNLMQEADYDYFWGWHPKFVANLLSLAVKHNVQKSFALNLAQKSLHCSFTDDGQQFFLLQISLLNTTEITLADRKLDIGSLTRNQRNLFGLLAASGKQGISLDHLQLQFWPDSPPEKARKSIDTLHRRLKKSLVKHLGKTGTDHIELKKGILRLKDYTLDCDTVLDLGKKGLRAMQESKTWQAGCYFTEVFNTFQSPFPAELFQYDRLYDFGEQTSNTFCRFCERQANQLAETGHLDEAIEVVEKLFSLKLNDDELTRLLYKLYVRAKSPMKANRVLKDYRQSLIRMGFPKEMIEEMVRDLLEDKN
ncbi:MAG: hypothetical protein ABFS19_10535 [Thermodesulfobacteriota bacterium]